MNAHEQIPAEAADEALKTDDILSGLTSEEAAIAGRILPALADKCRKEALARYGAEMRQMTAGLEEENRKALTAAIEKLQEAAKPLSKEELVTLLEQDFVTFDMKLTTPENNLMTVTIAELPGAAEKRLVMAVRRSIGPIVEAITSVEWEKLAGASQLDRILRLVELVPNGLNVLAECVAVCLNRQGQFEWLTGDWVMSSMGVYRMAAVLTAQATASRYRDFFSLAYRLYQQNRIATR